MLAVLQPPAGPAGALRCCGSTARHRCDAAAASAGSQILGLTAAHRLDRLDLSMQRSLRNFVASSAALLRHTPHREVGRLHPRLKQVLRMSACGHAKDLAP